MDRALKKRAVRRSILCIGILAFLVFYCAKTLPRVNYYLERANYHGMMERTHESAAKEYKRSNDELGGPADDYLLYQAAAEASLVVQHSRLRQQYRRAAIFFWECPPTGLPLPYPWNRDRDRRILEVVLLRLVDGATKPDSYFRRPESRNPAIIVDRLTTIGLFEDWYAPNILPSEFLRIDVAADLQRRNSEVGVPLTDFRFQTRQIVIDNLESGGSFSTFSERYPDAVGFVRVSLPGYSQDGNIAVVATTSAFTEHPSGTVYALELSGGEWRIVGEDNLRGE